MKCIKISLTILSAFFFFAVAGYSQEKNRVFLMQVEGTINPVVAQYISQSLKTASARKANSAVIKMDTPGGLMDSMRQIIKSMENTDIPVIVYVGDSGARAASAGAFITMASDVAVMAQGTNIGSAHPVKMGSDETGQEMKKKITEDARAFIKALAEKHGRNSEWAQKAVTESLSITASEAVEMNVVDFIVKDFEELKSKLEGLQVRKNDVNYTISFKGGVSGIELSFFKKFLNYIAHPNLAYILLIIGVYGLIYEFSNPGIGLGAAVGGISLLLAALAFQMIPVNTVGILLIIFGVVLLILDIFVPSFGILTVGGLISFIIGSLTLFDVREFPLKVSISLIIGAAITTALFFLFAVGSGLSAQRKKVVTGSEGMIGLKGAAIDGLNPEGRVFVRGETWQARCEGEFIPAGDNINVVGIEGNILKVEKIKEEK